jgi:hypothetical protein
MNDRRRPRLDQGEPRQAGLASRAGQAPGRKYDIPHSQNDFFENFYSSRVIFLSNWQNVFLKIFSEK